MLLSRLPLVLLAAVLASSPCACGKPDKSGAPLGAVSAQAPSLLPSTLAKQREALQAAYRVKPDVRFVRAFAVVDAIVAGAPREASATFADGHWTVKVGADKVGDLPELPSFGDAMSLLSSWGTRLAAAHPIAASPPRAAVAWDLVPPERAFDALEKLQAGWSGAGRNTGALEDAAQALVCVLAQTHDELELADGIGAHALAAVALVKGPARGDSARLEALLADLLGYAAAARRAAGALGPDDAIRAYVSHEDTRLGTIARTGDAMARALFLRRLEHTHDWKREATWRKEKFAGAAFTLPLLGARLIQPEILTERSVSGAMPAIALLAAADRAGNPRAKAVTADLAAWPDGDALAGATAKVLTDLGVTDATFLDTFQASVGAIGGGVSGGLFDAATEQAYYRAAMGTALYRAGLHALDRWNAMSAAKALLGRVAKGGGGFGDDFRAWYGALVRSNEKGKRADGSLWATAGVLPNLGPPASFRVARELEETADWGDPRMLGVAKQVFARADSRLAHRAVLLSHAYYALLDMAMVERLGRSLLDEGAPGMLGAAFVLQLLGDTAGLQRLLRDPDVGPEDAATIVIYIVRLGALDEAAARTEMARVVAAAPDSWHVRSLFAEYLESKGAYADARALISAWLVRNDRSDGLTPIEAKTFLAKMHYLEKDYATAWKIVEPLLPSQYGGAMMRGAYLLSALGRRADAETLAKARLARYPDITSVGLLAELYWRHGKNSEAGDLVIHPPVDAPLYQWRSELGKRFASEFGARPRADGVAAFAAMRGADPHHLREIATAVNQEGNHALAFALEEPLAVGGMENLEFLMRSTVFLEAAEGHAAAEAWLKPRVPRPMLEPLSQFAFGDKMDSLLWEIVPTPASDRTDEGAGWVWLFRAAASLRDPSSSHAAEIAAYFATADDQRASVIGRYLLGKVDEATVIARATDDKTACEVAFWLGYKAQTDRRYADASDWYRAAVESALLRVWEYRLAYNQLESWRSSGKALSRL